jgi:hypothetical protein
MEETIAQLLAMDAARVQLGARDISTADVDSYLVIDMPPRGTRAVEARRASGSSSSATLTEARRSLSYSSELSTRRPG